MTTFSDLLFLILRQIDRIPPSFWGVLVGSFFSLAAVALTNRASNHRLRAQFNHEQKQKTQDREMALRKEVYLDAAEAVAAGMNTIGRFANLDLPNDQVANIYTEKAPAIAKVHLIAKIETLQALVRFTSELGALFPKLFARRFELLAQKNAIAVLDNQIAQFGKERDRILEMMKQHNIEGIADQRRWDVLQANFEFQQKQIGEALAPRTEIANTLFPRQLDFMRECLSETTKLGQLLVPMLSAARAELELPFDEHAYRQVVEEGIATQQRAIDDFVQRFTPSAVQPTVPGDTAQ